jgi:hypothetical protein
MLPSKNRLWKVIFGLVTIAMLASVGNLLLQHIKAFETPTAVVPGPGSVGLYRWDGYHRIASIFHLKQR